MLFRILADTALLVHFCFILFVVFGGILVLYRRRFIWLHLPALVWGILVEFLRLTCPLTYLEKYLTALGGESAYAGDFIDHYVSTIIYPNIATQLITILGVALVAFNLVIYYNVFRQPRQPVKV